MSHAFVFASAESRLHADILVVRLKQAGIATEAISLLYPGSAQPNSVLCWLNGVAKFSLPSGEEIASSGRFGWPDASEDLVDTESLAEKLAVHGLAPEQCSSVEEILSEGRIVIAVESQNKAEMRKIMETLRYVGVENVFTSGRGFEARLVAA